jgi:hypothetical protein
MADYTRLSRHWVEWTTLAGMARVSVSTDCEDCQRFFISDDQSFHLRQDGDWWTIDSVDDRGRRYSPTANFSTFDLAEKYLIWTWASVTRGAIGARSLGRDLYLRGMAPNIEARPTNRDYFLEVRAPIGSAILPAWGAGVFCK